MTQLVLEGWIKYLEDDWIILKTGKGLTDYYKYWIWKTYYVNLIKPKWGAHVSTARGEKPLKNAEKWGFNDNKKVQFVLHDILYFGFDYFWFDVECKELEKTREFYGLNPHPRYGYHLTVGKIPLEVRDYEWRFKRNIVTDQEGYQKATLGVL